MRLTQIHRSPKRLLSTVQRGTAFEYRALDILTKHMSMSLTRVGGSYDGGVDLIGWWWVPSKKENVITTRAWSHPLDATVAPMGCTVTNRSRLRVLAQCKAEKRKMGPAYLRELEGVVHRYAAAATTANATNTTSILPHASKSDSAHVPQAVVPNDDPTIATKEPPPIALLVSESAFTRHCIFAANASPLPFLLVHLPPVPPAPSPSSTSVTSSGSSSPIGTVFGNPALISAKGLLGGELEIRWERGVSDGDGDGDGGSSAPMSQLQSSGMLVGAGADPGRPRLWWQGQPLPSWTPEASADVDVNA